MASVKYALKTIQEKPARFFKKLTKYYRNEDLFSSLIPNLYKESEYHWAEGLEKYKNNPCKGAHIGNIFLTLREYYPEDEFEYGNKDYLVSAEIIYKRYYKRIAKYMKKKYSNGGLGDIEKPWHDSITSFREQVFRGFILDPDFKYINKDKHYIKSTLSGDLIYPKTFSSFEQAYQFREKVGVQGYTGIFQPKHK